MRRRAQFRSLVRDLSSHLIDFQQVFQSKTRNCFTQACGYAQGLFKCAKKKATCTGITERLPGLASQSLNHMISDGAWSYQELMDRIADRTHSCFDRIKAPVEDRVLIVDETGFPKKGKHSACVGRQWLGCLGKQDNGQVAVGLALSHQHLYSLINMRLYMPESWANDRARRNQAKIPEDLQFKTKPEIAIEMIKKTVTEGIEFGWVGFDALYGACFDFLDQLDRLGLTFVGDIRSNNRIYLEAPNLSVPDPTPGKPGPKPKKLTTNTPSIAAEKYAMGLETDDWELIAFREGTKGDLQAWFHKKTIWIWDKKKPYAQRYTLILRKDPDSGEIKYSLTNACPNTPLERLAFMQGQRFFVEKSFKESKNQVGMGDYQVRGWEGFHRHAAISMLALNFLMERKRELAKSMPFITAEDIRRVIEFLLPNKFDTLDQLIDFIEDKHDQYQWQIELCKRRQRK